MEMNFTPKKFGGSIPTFYSKFPLAKEPLKKSAMLWTYSGSNAPWQYAKPDELQLTNC